MISCRENTHIFYFILFSNMNRSGLVVVRVSFIRHFGYKINFELGNFTRNSRNRTKNRTCSLPRGDLSPPFFPPPVPLVGTNRENNKNNNIVYLSKTSSHCLLSSFHFGLFFFFFSFFFFFFPLWNYNLYLNHLHLGIPSSSAKEN